MSDMRRTTITAPAEDLATLAAEAEHRDVALTAVVSEAIAEKAAAIRRSRKPRVGVARSDDGRAARDVAVDPVAHSPRG